MPKILVETNFQPLEIPRSGSKGKDGKERERKVGLITIASYALQRHLGWCTQSHLVQCVYPSTIPGYLGSWFSDSSLILTQIFDLC